MYGFNQISLGCDELLTESGRGRTAGSFDEPLVVSSKRRRCMLGLSFLLPMMTVNPSECMAQDTVQTDSGRISLIQDPNSYSGLVYKPTSPAEQQKAKSLPLLLVLHGAGTNQESAWSLADPKGEHAGLVPSLLAKQRAPKILEKNFVVAAPYSLGKRSFYEDPRSMILSFLDYVIQQNPEIDPSRVFLLGFSDGATVAVELATTQRFRALVVASYGFSGSLPPFALQRLKNIPVWVFHSADDVIFPVRYSERLVDSLRSVNELDVVRFNRYDSDPEGLTGSVRGHSMGITASKLPEVYEWMLSL